MNKETFKTPILLIAWRRPEKTLKVIEKIKQIKAQKIYIACDGYIKSNKTNINKVNETRKVLNDYINWKCEVKKLFCDYNQGCKKGVSNAIHGFKNEKEGIILEDDCLPHQDFLLLRRNVEKIQIRDRIWSITGQNIQNKFGMERCLILFQQIFALLGMGKLEKMLGNMMKY